MKIPELHGCCGCFSLRSGTKMIAYVQFTVAFPFMVVFAWLAGYAIQLNSDAAAALAPFYIVAACICGFIFIIAILLTVGVQKNRPQLFIPWLIVELIGVVAYIVTVIAACASGSAAGGTIAAAICSCIVSSALNIYFFLVVFSLRKQMLKEVQT